MKQASQSLLSTNRPVIEPDVKKSMGASTKSDFTILSKIPPYLGRFKGFDITCYSHENDLCMNG
jgi:murein endopeptidase